VRRALVVTAFLALSCGGAGSGPAALDPHNETCSWCRMTISDVHSAGQLLAPSEEPRFFDDIGCLGSYVARSSSLPAGTVAYVADHLTGQWIRAGAATYTRVGSIETPMGSHLMAHADAASRDADVATKGGTPQTVDDVFGPGGAPGGSP
jgi:copper chaperone NosL